MLIKRMIQVSARNSIARMYAKFVMERKIDPAVNMSIVIVIVDS